MRAPLSCFIVALSEVERRKEGKRSERRVPPAAESRVGLMVLHMGISELLQAGVAGDETF